jgi:transcriptional regulator with XRE-family HTH domain
MEKKKMKKLSEQIRQAVDASGLSRYRICKEIGLAQSTMSRFMAGGWLGKENIDALADLLGLSILVASDVIEDREDLKAARRAIADMKRKGEKPIPLDKLKAELGLNLKNRRKAGKGR